MTTIRILGGITEALLLWLLAASAMVGFEVNVRVLRPWQRTAYGIAAIVSGALLILRGLR